MSVRFVAAACAGRRWMDGCLAALEAETFVLVAMLLAVLCPTEWAALGQPALSSVLEP